MVNCRCDYCRGRVRRECATTLVLLLRGRVLQRTLCTRVRPRSSGNWQLPRGKQLVRAHAAAAARPPECKAKAFSVHSQRPRDDAGSKAVCFASTHYRTYLLCPNLTSALVLPDPFDSRETYPSSCLAVHSNKAYSDLTPDTRLVQK